MTATILLVDDHPVFRQGLNTLLGQENDLSVVAEANDGNEAIEAVKLHAPDLVVMDITMPNLDGIEATRKILSTAQDTKVVALSVHSGKQFVRDMIKAGASGYILKESVPEEMIAGIRSVLKGDIYLSSSISNMLLADYKNLIGDSQLQTEEFVSSLLPTKLHRPPISVDIIPRVRLIDLLEQGVASPITLISAPAGYGKSIAASQWLEVSKTPSCWVSLEDSENDLRLFLRYLVEAIQSIFTEQNLEIRSLLISGSLPSVQMIARYLLSDLDSLTGRFILVLDDYHHIRNQKVHDLLSELLIHSSHNLHIALLSRRDPPIPLAGLRSRGQLTEISVKELRFTVSETQAFLERFLHITITQQTAQVLEAKMEGWVTGLHLAALSIKNQEDQERLIAGLQATSQMVRDYLIQEVLGAVPEPYKWYLLRSSLLDRFCASLCDSLSADVDDPGTAVSGWDFIHWLAGTNLFVIALDPSNQWFRFHHLFQELLQNHLKIEVSTEGIDALQLKASNWFEQKGLIDEALKHALAAGNNEKAANIIERHREEAVNADQWYLLDKWLLLLPEEIVQRRPVLLLAHTWVLMHHFRFESVFPVVERVEEMIAEDPSADNLRGEIALCRGYCLFFIGDGMRSLEHMKKALEWVPKTYYEARAQTEVIYALSTQMVGDKRGAIHFLDDLLASYDSPESLRKTRLLITYVFIHYLSANFREAELANQRLKSVVDQGEYAYVAAWAAHMQGIIHLHRCEWKLAIKHLGYSVEQRFIHFHRTGIDSIVGLMLAYQAIGDRVNMYATLTILKEYVVSFDDPSLWVLVESAETRIAIIENRKEDVARWLEKSEFASQGAMIWWLEIPSLTHCRALIATGTSVNLTKGLELLEELSQYNQNHHNVYQLITIHSLQAIAEAALGDVEQSLQRLQEAVTLAQPGDLRFPFVEPGEPMREQLLQLPEPLTSSEFIISVLTTLESSTSHERHPAGSAAAEMDSSISVYQGIETLTNRELDVLELLSKRLQNKEIADELFISTETVKGHLKHIYQKLGVKGRRQAIEKARELRII